MVRVTLEEQGYAVLEASNGRAALHALFATDTLLAPYRPPV